ncbi:phosphatidate cytidylyltransferase [Clostridium acidisoli DSM 12555]|jgi:phosphatidate cytidylyltransferase|uniref:Phosphatidate cytidylyltransferase n=1 Tax=Clostridium acidisoli DSM 12555 TaxID=1121291 RepID=A0A1W1XCQ4_9CLOT|nr:phosphatidate cytidylyltransferase [Clostridium acidisoli]SMC21673.1 phosphatidate cytidylyltransferase [Clostridium acidisoli DSM 12555]
MNKRYIGAVILMPLVIFLLLGGIYLQALTLILSLFGMYEFYKVIRNEKINPISIVGYILCIIYYIILSNNLEFKYIMFIFTVAVFIMFCIPTLNTKYNFIDISVTMLGFIYVAMFFSFIVLVNLKTVTISNHQIAIGKYFVWLIFIASWMCDTTAYYSGRYLGKHKLCPKVSPKKTVEGSLGGLIGSILSCLLFGYIINTYVSDINLLHINLVHYAVIGLLCGVFSQFGDLAASSIKRYVKVKDYSNLIPGHGGILDRFDSILFSGVIVYYYVSFILNM